MRFVLVTALVLWAGLMVPKQALEHTAPSHPTPKLELRLIAVKPSIRPGEKLKLRVELWNIGAEDVIVTQNLNSTFGNSTLNLFLSSDRGGQFSGAIGDRIPDDREPDFEQTFVTSWLTLNRNHFVGTYVYVDPIEYPDLRKPGRYEVHASYFSRGISSTPAWNGSWLKQGDIDKLPFGAFQGTLNSTSVNVQVIGRRGSR